MPELPVGTVTFLFTDVEGSTRLWEQHPDAMRLALVRHDALIEALVTQHAGVVVRPRGEGDSRFAVFSRASAAVAAAATIQQALHAEPWPAATPLRVRIALHTGEADLRDGDYYGSAVNRCARLRAIAHGGQALVSRATSDLVQDALPPGVALRELGEQRLSDLARSEQVFQLVASGVPADFPPLRSLDALPHNLPLQLTSFIGREAEVATVRDLLAQQRLVTLTGPGGTGKTRLAQQVAAEALVPADGRVAFPDGLWLVELAALGDPGQVPQAVASAVGVREEPGHPLLATLAAALRPRQLLLLLDNCEHLLDACARLADTVLRACPHLTILATSREALGIAGETAWRVPSLAIPDLRHAEQPSAVAALTQYEAVRLFADRAVAVQPAFQVTNQNAPAVAQLCVRLDGIPLAIELAAARVRALSVDQLLARLEDRFRLLTGGSRTALERHQTLQAAVDWSYGLLTAPEQVLFRRLAVFAGAWSLEAAEAVCPDGPHPAGSSNEGLARKDVLDVLARLVDKSLVLADTPPVGPTRYRLLETLRQYALHKLVEAGEVAAVRARHAACCLALAEQAAPALWGPEQLAWLDRLEEEHDNLLLALGWLAEQSGRGEPAAAAATEAALLLGAALSGFWVIRSHFALAWEWLGRLLALPGADRTAARARVLAWAANVAFFRRDLPAARRLAADGLAMAQAVGDREGVAHAHFQLGLVAMDSRAAATTARPHLEASRRAFDALGAPSWAAQAVQALGRVALGAGDDQGAARLYAEAEALARPTGDGFTLSFILWNWADLARRAGDSRLARRLLKEALALRRAHRDPRGIGQTLERLGLLALAEGDAAAARRRLTHGVAVWRDAGLVWDVPFGLRDLARVAEAQGHPARAARLWSAAAAQHQAIVGRPLPAVVGPPSTTLDQAAEALRAQLGDTVFDAAWANGQAMSLEQAIAYALEDTGDR